MAKVVEPEVLYNYYFNCWLPKPKHKVRPAHIVGQLFMKSPLVPNSQGEMVHVLTPQQIYDEAVGVTLGLQPIAIENQFSVVHSDAVRKARGLEPLMVKVSDNEYTHAIQIDSIRSNCWDTFKNSAIPPGPAKLSRLSIWIGNLTSTENWNKGHGGAKIATSREGKTVTRFELSVTESMNIWGQIIQEKGNKDFQKEVDENNRIKEWIANDSGYRLIPTDDIRFAALPYFPSVYDSITDHLGRPVPNDPVTGEILKNFWNDQDPPFVLETKTEKEQETEPVTEFVDEEVNEEETTTPEAENENEDEVTSSPVDDELSVEELLAQIEQEDATKTEDQQENEEEENETPTPAQNNQDEDKLVLTPATQKASSKKKIA